ncbi:phosphoglucomutase/phosphomannomutase PgmG [Humitalea sp. 24SJ18S-53]|uniref:phosphoglucomutase/phosphomannomutase PgmG n=1 Tax=Humitalea sp. 24SJ18S-53 TaxID=3422307 RepID=UPI003D670E1F
MTSFRHDFHPTSLREYDIRGIVGQTLSAEDTFAIGRAFGTIVARNGGSHVVTGRDGRLSSPMLEAALIEGLMASGMKVTSVGCGPTPMLYYGLYHFGADGAAMITGSHNPPNYNGCKMMLGKKPFFGTQIQDLGRMAATGDVVTPDQPGSQTSVDLRQDYMHRMLKDYDGGERKLKVVWDPGNGSGAEITRMMVKHLPGEHIVINGEIDGNFPNHHPDPTVLKNLEQMIAQVHEHGADLGIAFDGDADRIGIVDNEGVMFFGDQLLVVLARDVLRDHPGATIIADVKASQLLFDEVAKAGGQPLMWKTGHSLIKAKMAETGAPLAGEMSGHVFFADKWYGFDDAPYSAIRLLGIVARMTGKLSDVRHAFPVLLNTPELRFNCPDERKFDVVAEVKARLAAEGAKVNDVDGVRVLSDDGWWLLRASNTQAVLVARAEASTEAGLERLKAQIAAQVVASGLTAPDFSGENAGH